MTQHTPGPWIARKMNSGLPWWRVEAASRCVADVEGGGRVVAYNAPDKPELVAADAKLIAASPDLLTALRALIWQMDRMNNLPEEAEAMIRAAKAAVAKAEG